MIEYYKAILKDSAFDIVGAAPNGFVALNMVRETAPDVVVLDIAMPRMTGIELAKRLRADGCLAAFVFVSSDDGLAADAIAAGGSAFVSKNLADAYLLTAIREA